jgi:hypothetical protein
MLETIRDTECDLKFYKKISKMLLKNEEIAKLKIKSTWEEDDWLVPPFVLKAKEISLPKVNGRSIVEKEKDERDLEIDGDHGSNIGGRRSTGESDNEYGVPSSDNAYYK